MSIACLLTTLVVVATPGTDAVYPIAAGHGQPNSTWQMLGLSGRLTAESR